MLFYALNDVFLTLGQPEDEPASRQQLGSEGERRRTGAGLSLMREGLCEGKHKSHGATTCRSFFHSRLSGSCVWLRTMLNLK